MYVRCMYCVGMSGSKVITDEAEVQYTCFTNGLSLSISQMAAVDHVFLILVKIS